MIKDRFCKGRAMDEEQDGTRLGMGWALGHA